jgi:transmembrane protein 33
VTYGIVVYKAFRARARSGSKQQGGAIAILGDENVQYLRKTGDQYNALNTDADSKFLLVMALIWLYSRQMPLALLPFTVYSVFHVATYTRTNLIPTIQPPKQSADAPTSPSGKPAYKGSPLGDYIGKFVKDYYDSSMMLVAVLEIMLWFRVLLSAITFTKGSWILLVIYTIFFRARYAQSSFVQNAFHQYAARGDALVSNQSTPPAVRQGWDTFKGLVRKLADATDLGRYVGASRPGMKKAQ